MASQLPDKPEPDELANLRKRLKSAIHWRDRLTESIAMVDADIARDARAFADLNGDKAKPTIDQLRRMLFEKEGFGP